MSDLYMQLDEAQLDHIVGLFADLSPRIIRLAFHRAQRRTEGTVRQQAVRMMQQRLQLASGAQKRLRKRVQAHLKPSAADASEMKYWFGLNDIDPALFRGGIRRVKGGLMIRGTYYERAFVAVLHGKKKVMQRVGKAAYPVVSLTVPISDEMTTALEDELFERIPDIFLRHFETDLRGRVTSDAWKTGWSEKNLAAAEQYIQVW
ncbi:hypothetical protein RHD99_14710 [Buttiauxella selenatireducens]|uniref:Phage tail protein n=1 Tax=Buttiauxella selenatireducens TaxID=3073902 RepID=A0ABY9S5D2_9ENTR|nr:hypothetical protein [Buttiauxella sp. R73]WMY72724.1 hypothetical protein RHD99_14710 [Buttiauxella sp. R73]